MGDCCGCWSTLLVALGAAVAAFYLLRKWVRGPECSSTKRLDGKVAVITGANTGIGYVTALELARRGARVHMLCRDTARGATAVDNIKAELAGVPSAGSVVLEKLDLSSLESVRSTAEKLLHGIERIDLLILNAGVMLTPLSPRTADGFEMQMGTNHLGHFLFTRILLPLIRKTARENNGARIVIVSSTAHNYARKPIRLDDLNWERDASKFIMWQGYAQSKLANILFCKELAKRLAQDNTGAKVNVYALHPGVITTELGRYAAGNADLASKILHYMYAWMGFILKTPWHGAQTTLYCCLSEELANHTGRYYSDCAEATPSKFAQREDDAQKLWELSEKLVGCKNRPFDLTY